MNNIREKIKLNQINQLKAQVQHFDSSTQRNDKQLTRVLQSNSYATAIPIEVKDVGKYQVLRYRFKLIKDLRVIVGYRRSMWTPVLACHAHVCKILST